MKEGDTIEVTSAEHHYDALWCQVAAVDNHTTTTVVSTRDGRVLYFDTAWLAANSRAVPPDDPPELTVEERRAIAALRRLAKRWPKTLWLLLRDDGGLKVMRTGPDGKHVMMYGGWDGDEVDPAYVVAEVDSLAIHAAVLYGE